LLVGTVRMHTKIVFVLSRFCLILMKLLCSHTNRLYFFLVVSYVLK